MSAAPASLTTSESKFWGYKAYVLGFVYQQLENVEESISRAGLSQSFHCTGSQVERLLQVVETNEGVDLIPVLDPMFDIWPIIEGEGHFFVEEQVEQSEEELAVVEFLGEFLHFWHPVGDEDFVDEGF